MIFLDVFKDLGVCVFVCSWREKGRREWSLERCRRMVFVIESVNKFYYVFG